MGLVKYCGDKVCINKLCDCHCHQELEKEIEIQQLQADVRVNAAREQGKYMADKAREQGRQEAITQMQPDTIVSNIEVSAHQEERNRILGLIEGMMLTAYNSPELFDATGKCWNQALEAIKNKINEN